MTSRTPREAAQQEWDWDGYHGAPTSIAAVLTAEAWTWVPLAEGGLQGELHSEGMDVEIEIDAKGRIASVYWGGRRP